MGEEISSNIKDALRAVLLSAIKGIPENQLERDFKKVVGEPLKWKELGFKSLFDFLSAVPDVARMEWSDKHKENLVFGVGNDEFFMSVHAKKAQGNPSQAKPPKTPEMKRKLLGSTLTPPRQYSCGKYPKSTKATLSNASSRPVEIVANKHGLYEIHVSGLPRGCKQVR